MISFKRFSAWKGEGSAEGKGESLAQDKPARDAWGVIAEPMTVSGEAVYALSFHRKGTSLYYLHRHYRNRDAAEKEFDRISKDLGLSETEFEAKYALSAFG